MAAELSGDPLTMDLDWADGWCRHVSPPGNRNRRLPHGTRVSALSPEIWRDENLRQTSRTSSQRSTSADASNARSPKTTRQSTKAKQPEPEILDDDEVTAFVLSEVLKALRLHPEAKTAVREHFNALEDQLEREWLQELESGNGHAE